MKNPVNIEDRILSALAFACYGFALTGCGSAAYALVMLTTYFSTGQSIYPTASQF
jgi:hypothetical protein